MAGVFQLAVAGAVAKRKDLLRKVMIASTQDLVRLALTPKGAGGKMPVDTGYLRSSLRGSTAAPLPLDRAGRPVEGGSYAPDSSVQLAILGLQPGIPLYLTFTAVYARVQEYRNGFVRSAAAEWQAIVARNAAKAEALK